MKGGQRERENAKLRTEEPVGGAANGLVDEAEGAGCCHIVVCCIGI